MAKTVIVKLGETNYVVPHLNLGQIEELTEVWADGADASPRIARFQQGRMAAEIILRRAMPAIDDIKSIECTPEELRTATDAVLRLSGLTKGAPVGEALAAEQA